MIIHPDHMKRVDRSRRTNVVASPGQRLLRILAVAVGTAALAVFSTVLALDEANAASITQATSTTAAAAATTACSATPVPFGGQQYCPGYVVGVKRGLYGVGTSVVLRGVTVDGVSARTIVVSGGPSCLPDPSRPPVWCGAIVPRLVVPTASLTVRPRLGEVINLYGITDRTTLNPTGYAVIGYCDPIFGC